MLYENEEVLVLYNYSNEHSSNILIQFKWANYYKYEEKALTNPKMSSTFILKVTAIEV